MNRFATLCLCWFLVNASDVLAQMCESPNMMILLDRSGSMSSDPQCDSSQKKWSDAVSAIDYVVNNFSQALQFGLSLFPTSFVCASGQVFVDVGPNTASQILAQLDAFPPYPPQGGYACLGGTPMAASLSNLNQYRLLKDIQRRNFVLLVTDGQDTCTANAQTDPVNSTADLLSNGIQTFVIGFGSGVDSNVLNAMAAAGGTGSYYQADNQNQLQQAMNAIINQALVETCDNKDNDCDGQVDEDWPQKGSLCMTHQNGCEAQGVYVCNSDGSGLVCDAQIQITDEICDGLDNDCDGLIDEDFADEDLDGYTICVDCCDSGQEDMLGCSELTRADIHPDATEVCNGYDDNCNQVVDESDPQNNQACGESDVGECEFGNLLCLNGQLACIGEGKPVDEINCDELDNDCDGATDEDKTEEICDDQIDNDCDGAADNADADCAGVCQPGQREFCGNASGDCVAGVRICQPDGTWGPCEGGWSGSDEICDGRDNDCDGLTDEDDVCGTDLECEPGETRACGTDVGECQQGVQVCTAEGKWSSYCSGEVSPQAEWCDGADNDCDGQTDEGHLCDDYDLCLCGACAPPCSVGECPTGTWSCVEGYCVHNLCCGIKCPAGQECDGYGHCVDKCVMDAIQCPDGQVCSMGLCVEADCHKPGHECPEGERCVAGECQEDACHEIVCEEGSYCLEGDCLGIGCVDCTETQICQAGECVDSACANIPCAASQICVDGQCTADPCQGVYCPLRSICLNGECTSDPCDGVDCPAHSRCEKGYCISAPQEPTDAGTDAGSDLDGSHDASDGDEPVIDAGPVDDSSDAGPSTDSENPSNDNQVDGGVPNPDGEEDGCKCSAYNKTPNPIGLLLVLLAFVFRKRISTR